MVEVTTKLVADNNASRSQIGNKALNPPGLFGAPGTVRDSQYSVTFATGSSESALGGNRPCIPYNGFWREYDLEVHG